MDPIFEIELEDCPICRGVGAMQDEQGWCVSVNCLDLSLIHISEPTRPY